MAILLHARSLSKSFGLRPLFHSVALAVDDDARIGLIGPNGSGKSTLLKILAGRQTSDDGSITMRKGLRVGYVAQADLFADGATPLSAVVDALGESHHDAHERQIHAEVTLDKVGFTRFDQPAGELSGGWRKRLAIACELAREPDLLLLDEPTNHLDLEGILWLEDMLDDADFAAIIVTHDRYFLEEATTRIVELSNAYPEGTFEVDGPYSEFLRRRAEFMAAQAHQQMALSSKVRQDIAWLQRGAKARRTKVKGRIRDAAQRSAELAELKTRNAPQQAAGIDFNATGRKTRNLLVATNISKAFGDMRLFANLDLTLSPGTRVGLIGHNGSGKTTLIKVLTGELPSDTGTIKRADDLRIVTFTQRRDELDRTKTLRDTLCPIGDKVYYRDREIHVVTWAQQFLFRKDQLNVPVGDLSGGEQARIFIADLMRQPADLLILDEPTNDLDIASLDVLERSLEEFPGAVVLVTHDRFMLDRLSTMVLGLDGKGTAKEFATYTQWSAAQEAQAAAAEPPKPKSAPTARPVSGGKAKLSYKEQREWDQMEANIHGAEAVVAELESRMSDPALLGNHQKLQEHCRKLDEAQAKVAALYDRWAELETKLQ
jgi:ATP-binding cassette subfamily F protein uup